MAKKGKQSIDSESGDISPDIDFSSTLISELNKEFGEKVAYNLVSDEAPSTIKRWISTGSRVLDYVISNRRHGGVPEGRVIEIFGPPSIGKSHLAYQMARNTQAMGGLVIYIDTENATSVEHLKNMGIDVAKRFVFCEAHMTERVFSIMDSTIVKAKQILSKDVPILVIWDSVAATSPKQELDGDYDRDTIGLQARVISKGMRKIVGLLGQNNVTLVCLNQIRTKVGAFIIGDPTAPPGGMSISFHSSARIKLTGGSQIKGAGGEVLGINVKATILKNKVARPHRIAEFGIVFGKGIVESEQICDLLRSATDKGTIMKDGKQYIVEGSGAWKTFSVISEEGEVIHTKKFTKNQVDDLFKDPETGPHLEDMLEAVMTSGSANEDPESAEGEVQE